MNKRNVFAAGVALAVLFGGNTATSFAAQDVNPVHIASAGYNYSDTADQVLNYINEMRTKMGIQQVKLNPFLTKAAENHANYIVVSGNYAHEEIPSDKGFTGVEPWDRTKAVGGDSSLYQNQWEIMSKGISDPIKAVDNFLATVYHREPLMSPYASEIGVSIIGNVVVIEVTQDMSGKPNPVVYPYDKQTNINVMFDGNENPNPLAQFGVSSSGQVITIITPYSLKRIDATLTNSKGESVPFFTPFKDNGFWHIIPKSSLAYNETYTVSVNYSPYFGSDAGKVFNKTWSFTTQNAPDGKSSQGQTQINGGNKTPTPSGSISALGFNSNNIGIKINGRYVNVSPKAKIVGESTFIPLRGVFEAMNAKVTWNAEDQSIDVVRGDVKVHLQIGNTTATVNGKDFTLTTAPFISEEGSTYVPLRFISETIGANVGWDAYNWTASIDVN